MGFRRRIQGCLLTTTILSCVSILLIIKWRMDIYENVTMTLLLAHMRSGSTLIGEIIHNSERDFYLFEPLHAVERAVKSHGQFHFIDGAKRNFSFEEARKKYPEFLYRWFVCDFYNIDIGSLTDPFIEIYTPDLHEYYLCVNQTERQQPDRHIVHKCTSILYEKCKVAKSRTIKSVRISLAGATQLMQWLPNLKVIHLVRDPRGVFQSMANVGLLNWTDLQRVSGDSCGKISRDIEDYQRLKKLYPYRITRVVYENFCADPFLISSKLYKFLNFNITKQLVSFLNNNTKGAGIVCQHCTNRGDAFVTAYKWLHEITQNHTNIIDRHCSNIYTKIGYLQIPFDKLKLATSTWHYTKVKN